MTKPAVEVSGDTLIIHDADLIAKARRMAARAGISVEELLERGAKRMMAMRDAQLEPLDGSRRMPP